MVKEQLWKGVRFCFFDRHQFGAPDALQHGDTPDP
jgi:hypothetical protein